MQYTIPQFVEVEDKVIGPLTTKQFLYLVAGGVFLVIAWSFADVGLFVILVILTAIAVIPFAFVKINGRSFEIFLSAIIKFYTRPKLRLWIKDVKALHAHVSDIAKRAKKFPSGQTHEVGEKRFNRSKIRELSHILDMGGAAYQAAPAEVEEIEKVGN
jgi:hypothetical protein